MIRPYEKIKSLLSGFDIEPSYGTLAYNLLCTVLTSYDMGVIDIGSMNDMKGMREYPDERPQLSRAANTARYSRRENWDEIGKALGTMEHLALQLKHKNWRVCQDAR